MEEVSSFGLLTLFGQLSPVFLVGIVAISYVVLMVGIILAVRYFTLRASVTHHSVQKRVLHILVPKESAKKEEESRGSASKDVKSLIAVAESMYEGLGGIKAKSRWRAFFFGRDDEIALELIAIDGLIKFYAIVPEHLVQLFSQQLQAQYSSAQIMQVEDYNLFRPKGVIDAVPLRLTQSTILPLRTYKKMDTDPLNALTNALSKVEETQGAAVQIVFRTAAKKWRKYGQKVAHDMQQGKSLSQAMGGGNSKLVSAALGTISQVAGETKPEKPAELYRHSPLEQELIKAIDEKSSKASFEVNVRVVTSADTMAVAKMHMYNIVNVFSQYTGLESGITFKKDKYFSMPGAIKNFIHRAFDEKRTIVLNSEELASLFHPPLSSTETPHIEWLTARSAPPPVNLPEEGIVMGESVYRGSTEPVRILREDRRRHVYVIGQTGSGKTTIMVNMIIQDIKNGEGCCFVDPHGDAIDDILANIPPERADDVVLFSPADFERPLGLNLLEFDPKYPEQKTFVINEFIQILDKLYDLRSTGGPMFEQYLRNALLLIMDDPESGSTLMEVSKVLADEDFRKYKLSKSRNPVVRDFWIKEAQKAGGDAALANMVPYITSKLNQFIANDIMRPIIGQQQSAFNVRELMDNKKILLVKLSKGQLGDLNAYLLGLIIVGKLTMAALSRGDLPESQRSDFYLYIDEFQNFITDSIATILSEARKYRLDLTIGHQYIGQLTPRAGDTKVREAVFGNVGTIVSFRVGVDDAEMMARQMAPVFTEYDVINIEARNAYVRLLINNTASRPFNFRTLPKPAGDVQVAKAISQLSRLKHGRDRELIEQEILARAGRFLSIQ